SGVASRLVELAEGLEVDAARMKQNLGTTSGLIMGEAVQMALGATLGRLEAHDLLEAAGKRALKSRRPLFDLLAEMPEGTKVLPRAKLKQLFDPLAYLGSAESFLERALQHAEKSLNSPKRRKR